MTRKDYILIASALRDYLAEQSMALAQHKASFQQDIQERENWIHGIRATSAIIANALDTNNNMLLQSAHGE